MIKSAIDKQNIIIDDQRKLLKDQQKQIDELRKLKDQLDSGRAITNKVRNHTFGYLFVLFYRYIIYVNNIKQPEPTYVFFSI